MEKMTYVKAIEIALTSMADGEAKDKMVALKASLEKKATAERKPTKTQKENVAISDTILSEMEIGKAYRISDMVSTFTSCVGLSPNKVSALVRTLKDAHKVERFEEKRVAYFRKVVEA